MINQLRINKDHFNWRSLQEYNPVYKVVNSMNLVKVNWIQEKDCNNLQSRSLQLIRDSLSLNYSQHRILKSLPSKDK